MVLSWISWIRLHFGDLHLPKVDGSEFRLILSEETLFDAEPKTTGLGRQSETVDTAHARTHPPHPYC